MIELTPTQKVQYGYDFVNNAMQGNGAYTACMITETLRAIDLAYWRLTRTERHKIHGRR